MPSTANLQSVSGAGLGLRRGLVEGLKQQHDKLPDFLEVTPENWMNMGGRFERNLRFFTERYPVVCHGLSLSLGGPEALDQSFIDRLGKFFEKHNVLFYSEHLSYCSDGGHLYDLIPLPFTDEAIEHVSKRIRAVQEQLGRRIAIENVSAYTIPTGQYDEQAFVQAVLDEADCDLMLDVNNVYVNSQNHGFDAKDYIAGMPTERIAYMHVAGHLQEAPDLIIDTHGDSVVDPVWDLLEFTYAIHGNKPTLLERDFNLPPLSELLDEVQKIRDYQARASLGSKKIAGRSS
jgi:uncharacterized protein (UPF0276 family)